MTVCIPFFLNTSHFIDKLSDVSLMIAARAALSDAIWSLRFFSTFLC